MDVDFACRSFWDSPTSCFSRAFANIGTFTFPDTRIKPIASYPPMASNEAKARGNAAFTAQRYEEAVVAFSEGIAVDPDNHILYR